MSRQVHAYAYLERPYERVRLAFSNELVDVLEQVEADTNARALTVSQRLSAHFGPFEVGTRIDIEPTGFEQTPRDAPHASCSLRLTWRAARAESLFPIMHADLVAHPVGEQETQLALFGTYTPPLGALGTLGDAVLGHRVAEASAHRFVEALVRRLEELVPAPEPEG